MSLDPYQEEPEITLFTLIPGSGYLIRLCAWMALQWRAFKLQCARAWFHYHRGKLTRHDRDYQHRSTGVIARTTRKISRSPIVFYTNYRDNRAWLFTTITGTIGLLLLILLFLKFWWQPATVEPPIVDNVPELEQPEAEFISFDFSKPIEPDEFEPTDELEPLPPVIVLEVETQRIVEEDLSAEFFEQSRRKLPPFVFHDVQDIWVAYKERPPEEPTAPSFPDEPAFLDFSETEPTVTYDPPDDEPIIEEPEPEPEENITIKKVFPRTRGEEQPSYYTLLITNAGLGHVDQKVIEEQIPEAFRIAHTEPSARLNNGTLFWTLRDLAPGERREIRIELTPPEPVKPKPEVKVEPPQPEIERPNLEVRIDQPNIVRAGEAVPIRFHIQNKGRSLVRNISLKTQLPAQLDYPKGRDLHLEISSLAPGETRTIRLTPTAVKTGQAEQTLTLTAMNFKKSESSSLEVKKPAPPKRKKKVVKPKRVPAPQSQPAPPIRYYNPCCPTPRFDASFTPSRSRSYPSLSLRKW